MIGTATLRDLHPALRPLPRTLRPVLDETLDSYLGRLATANKLDVAEFRRYLTGTNRIRPVTHAQVAAVSGQAERTLRYALLELATDEELAGMKVAGRPRPGFSVGTKCRCCTATLGIATQVSCWRQAADLICVRHQRWPTKWGLDLDLSKTSDILQANKLHRKLLRRHGREPVITAFRTADDICREWNDRHRNTDGFERRMELILGPNWRVADEDPAIVASRYPETVALTRLIATPYLRALALQRPIGNDTFISELQRTVFPGYSWYPISRYRYLDPLVRWTGDMHDPDLRLDHLRPGGSDIIDLRQSAADQTRLAGDQMMGESEPMTTGWNDAFANQYEEWSAHMKADVAFYVDLARVADGPLVELAVGNGRVAIPVARATGRRVIGIDSSSAMLAQARAGAAAAGVELDLREGDLRDLSLGEPAALIYCPFRSLQHLPTWADRRRTFERVAASLLPQGRFAWNAIAFDHRIAARLDGEHQLEPVPHTIRYSVGDNRIDIVRDDGATSSLWWATKNEWLGLLDVAGLELEALYGGFGREPFDDDSREYVFVARPHQPPA